ncbi:MAG TPA: type II toxin-antitoxin system prevent-host-death family antitoxin [Candidatus Limnocylindria bacterium]
MAQRLSVAEAKRRFSEIIERVSRGERFTVTRRGKPALTLVPPELGNEVTEPRPIGLAAVAGALADWTELDQVVSELYESRRRAKDRPAPDLG